MDLRWLGWVGASTLLACQDPITVGSGGGSSTTDAASTGTTATPADGTTTAEPGTSSGSPTSDTTGGGPPMLPDPCDPIAQDCPDGYKCSFYFDEGATFYDATRCVEVVDRPNPELQPCTIPSWPPDGNDDCDATSFCFDVDRETLAGVCIPFCIGDFGSPTCADPCHQCAIAGDGVLTPCIPTCDPLAPDCPVGQACYPTQQVFSCLPELDTLGPGQPCDIANACASGSACLSATVVPGCPAGASGCCSPYCNPAQDFDPCPMLLPGSTCTPYYDGEPPLPECGYPPPGACVAP